jgi:mono/diheme cytochrome c family protein
MLHTLRAALLAGGFVVLAAAAAGQETPPVGENGVQPQPQPSYQNMSQEQRAAATRAFLGLGPAPDKAAAARGAPIFLESCAFCHGPQARGATGPSLITSDEVLGDDHGERLVLFLKKGRPEKGMPAYASMPDDQLKDLSEFLHQQVEDVANRGTYRVLNILVGNAAKGQDYVGGHCAACHDRDAFAQIAGKFRTPDQLQRGWVWPARAGNEALAITAVVTMRGSTVIGRVTQISDFRITLVDSAGQTRAIDRKPGVEVELKDPLAPHQAMIPTLTNDDMHNVTAYFETLQ